MTRKKNIHKSNKTTPWYFKKWWKIIGIIIIIAAIITTAVVWRTLSTRGQTRMKITTNQPISAQFTDNNTTSLISNNAIVDINNSRELNRPGRLLVTYDITAGNYAPAFRSAITDSDINKGVKITPFIKGVWKSRDGNSLEFTPAGDWPANTRFNIKISKKLINPDIVPNSYQASFNTAPISATIENFNIYPMPNAPKTMTAVAVLSFNYPIDIKDFNNKVSMKLDGEKLDFSVKFDRFHRTVFIISSPITVTDSPQTVRLKLNRIPALYGDDATKKLTAAATIESADNFFKITSLDAITADTPDGNSEQLLLLNTTAGAAKNTDWNKFIQIYLLPKKYNNDSDENTHTWAMDEITPEVLHRSTVIPFKQTNFATPAGVYQYAFTYNISDNEKRYMYVSVRGGAQSAGGFILQNGIDKILPVPYPERQVKIAGSGAILSLAGDKKLGIMARGGAAAAYINLYKVKSDEINHLISQTYDVFANNMEFKSWAFGAYDMSVVFQKKITFADSSMNKTNYSSVDLGDYLNRTHNDNTGIFIIQAGPTQNQANYSDKRLILLTNFGIIRKLNHSNNTSDIFVSILSTGAPAADTAIEVLGRNGNPVWAGRTDNSGHVIIPALPWSEYKNEKEPVAIVARSGDDVSFIPYNAAYAQRVEYSKFDIDGTYSSATTPLNAFVFTDRGIYRPGENAIIAGVIKNKTFNSLAGIPVRIEIYDARGRTVFERVISLASDGMFDIKYAIGETAAIGEYNVNVFSVNSKNKSQDLLGNAYFRIEEFVPDTLKINAAIPGASDNGWLSPDGLNANVSLYNLFGTPAVYRRITASVTMTPVEFSFPEYKNYIFTPNFISGSGMSDNTATRVQTFSQQLPDAKTNNDGETEIPITFDHTIPSGTYKLTMNIHGFEGATGKSVQTTISARVSDAKYIIGYLNNSDLGYINQNARRSVNIIAIDHTAARTSARGITMRLLRRENLTSLIKDYNNYYKYQTITRDSIISQSAINIPDTGMDIPLATENAGTYFLQLLDASGKILANIEYFVAGTENASLQSDTRADLKIKLNASEYAPGDDIAISVTAPYTGTGLITIERDKVYAYKWFTANTTSSVQHITVPDGFEGTGYINVSFVRDIHSRDVFTTPYTYAVAPMRAEISQRRINIDLSAPDVIRDNKLTVKYKTNSDARIMIFAVNTGILQVAKYKIPNPLEHFFQKAALQVETYQILSLLLPEYNILREYAKTGGGDFGGVDGEMGGIFTNPFGRKTNAPVAFYSEIISARANTPGTITFDIPDYFNGAVKIFAVAANDSAVGATDISAQIQSPIIISTTAPLFAAPGDIFDVNTVITNLTDPTLNIESVKVSATVSDNLDIINKSTADLTIAKNSEKLWTFGVKTGDKLGNANITIDAIAIGQSTDAPINKSATATMSLRPVTTYKSNITTGTIKSDKTTIKNFDIATYPEFANRKIYISANASTLIRPLFEYLNHYDYTCTEQLVSRALPYAIAPNSALIGTSFDKSAEKINAVINTLKNRQNDDGSFDLWTTRQVSRNNESNPDAAYITAYVAQFLTIANDAGFNVPQNMLSRAINFLRTYAGTNIQSEFSAAASAFAIYVITQNGYVTTGYINRFEEYANANIKDWQSKLIGAYIAASYKMLKQSDIADKIIEKYQPSKNSRFEYISQFNNNIANDAIYSYLAGKYFDYPAQLLPNISEYINRGEYTSYTSAMIILGLSRAGTKTGDAINSVTVTADDTEITGTTESGEYIATIPENAKKLVIKCPECDNGNNLFYTTLAQGFPRTVTTHSSGIDIVREYYNSDGDRITTATVGDMITVKIYARTRGTTDEISDVVITDLLPGGFIPDAISGDMTFSEIREDRVLIYTDLTRDNRVITYTAQIGTAGRFQIPPIQATAMYNPALSATGKTGDIFTVSNAAD